MYEIWRQVFWTTHRSRTLPLTQISARADRMHVENSTQTKRKLRVSRLRAFRRTRHDEINALQKVVSRLWLILFYAFVSLIVLLPSARSVWAQGDASLAGAVRDASGAGIPDAMVHIKNLETGTERDL